MSISIKSDGKGRALLRIGAKTVHLAAWEVQLLRGHCDIFLDALGTKGKSLGPGGRETLRGIARGLAALFPVTAPKKVKGSKCLGLHCAKGGDCQHCDDAQGRCRSCGQIDWHLAGCEETKKPKPKKRRQ